MHGIQDFLTMHGVWDSHQVWPNENFFETRHLWYVIHEYQTLSACRSVAQEGEMSMKRCYRGCIVYLKNSSDFHRGIHHFWQSRSAIDVDISGAEIDFWRISIRGWFLLYVSHTMDMQPGWRIVVCSVFYTSRRTDASLDRSPRHRDVQNLTIASGPPNAGGKGVR